MQRLGCFLINRGVRGFQQGIQSGLRAAEQAKALLGPGREFVAAQIRVACQRLDG